MSEAHILPPRASEVRDRVVRAALCKQMAEWLPTFSNKARSLFDKIIDSHPVKDFSGNTKRYEDLSIDKLETLYDLCWRTAVKP